MKINAKYAIIKITVNCTLLFLHVYSIAQCSNINKAYHQSFGRGVGIGDSLPSYRTNCKFTTDSCPPEGYYTVLNHSSGCFQNSWYPVTSDNSPEDYHGYGYLMMINAPAEPGNIYIDTLNDLCANTSFGFEAAVTKMSLPSSCNGNPINPVITLHVETPGGTVLAISTVRIDHYGVFVLNTYFITTSIPGPVIIRITDDAPGGCGNAFTMDDVDVWACGPLVSAGLPTNSEGIYVANIFLCEGDNSSVTLSGTVENGYNFNSYQWQIYRDSAWVDISGATSLAYIRNATPGTGTYEYRLTAAEGNNILSPGCRIASNEIYIYVHAPAITVTIANNSPVCVNDTIMLRAGGGRYYQWSGPDNFTSSDAAPLLKATKTSGGRYQVIVNDGEGCLIKDSTFVTTIPPPAITISNSKDICLGDSVTLEASGGKKYVWSPVNYLSDADVENPVAKPNVTTTYTVNVTDTNQCYDTASVKITVNKKPVINAGEDKIIMKGQSVTLDASIKDSGNVNFVWSPASFLNDNHLLNPVANPVTSTDYILTATANGCGAATGKVSVIVYNGLYIPNAFTPNGDGLNDDWEIPALHAYPNAVVSVYNRFGQKIFESKGSNGKWNGTYKNFALPSGSYPYFIDLKNNSPVIKGVVVIIR
jgi:gliding motility-associated-like protein